MIDLNKYRKWIDAALEYSGGTHTFEDVAQGIISGNMQLWPGDKGCAVTEIVLYPKKKVLHVFLAAGDMAQLIDMIDDAAAWGVSHGCQSMTMSGRHGWLRVLGKEGWKPVMTVMEREI